jgi:hypothetical protein
MKIEVFAEDNTAAEKIAEFYCDETVICTLPNQSRKMNHDDYRRNAKVAGRMPYS